MSVKQKTTIISQKSAKKTQRVEVIIGYNTMR